ncbi:carbohydrate phosphatase [Trichocladium antarcticum]|uniref:Carbohydrate phosphatase n=1 Tax=Trichocladium antarcticum TaxID=1450529 RepID=A0AAN6UD62_9PEZI|nr:carbohydrate phosphatase [Trichocladium antarcticum]
MDSPYRPELEAAIGAVQTAAHISRVALATAQKDAAAGSFDVVKDDLSPVTVADFAIQALLARVLHGAFPHDGFVGEESADELRQSPALLSRVLATIAECAGASLFRDADDLCAAIDSCTTASNSARTWVFDPIDGTKTFIRGEQYAINVALLEDGEQILSVVGCPLLSADATAPIFDASVDPTGAGCMLFAVRGHGAYVRPLLVETAEVQPRRLPRHADNVTSPDGLRSVTCWALLDSGVDTVHKAVAEQLGVPFPGCDLLGWVPRWAVMALGLANMTVWVYKTRDRHAKIWDHAGAMLLFEEVGGIVTDVHGKPIDLASGRKLEVNFGFVAAPKAVHHLVLRTVLDTLKVQGRDELLS